VLPKYFEILTFPCLAVSVCLAKAVSLLNLPDAHGTVMIFTKSSRVLDPTHGITL
jgi:hypothetical protein